MLYDMEIRLSVLIDAIVSVFINRESKNSRHDTSYIIKLYALTGYMLNLACSSFWLH